VRTINATDLRQVTPDAKSKDRFVLIDAIGVTESVKTTSQPLERKRAVPFDRLLQSIASGDTSEDALSSMAGRLAAVAPKIADPDHARVRELTGGKDVNDIARDLWRSLDPDVIEADASARGAATDAAKAKVAAELRAQATRIFDEPKLRKLLLELKEMSEIVIDEGSPDRVISAGFDVRQAETKVASFRRFIEENKDELTALQILYSRPHAQRRLTWKAVTDLRDAMARPPWLLEPSALWNYYKRLNAGKVRERSPGNVLSDVVALVRFALAQTDTLQPLSAEVEQRFNLWLGREKNAGRTYSDNQMRWLLLIRDHIAANVEMTLDDLQDILAFADDGGRLAANRVFSKNRVPALIDDLNDALVA
jgi:type I restriction enzyme, R subunit